MTPYAGSRTPSALTLTAARDNFAAALPGLKHVRNSAEHGEDRVRGQAFGKKIATQRVSNSLIHAPNGGAIAVDALNDHHFGGTIADGTYTEVEVADATIEIARTAVQATYDALPWRSDTAYTSRVNETDPLRPPYNTSISPRYIRGGTRTAGKSSKSPWPLIRRLHEERFGPRTIDARADDD